MLTQEVSRQKSLVEELRESVAEERLARCDSEAKLVTDMRSFAASLDRDNMESIEQQMNNVIKNKQLDTKLEQQQIKLDRLTADEAEQQLDKIVADERRQLTKELSIQQPQQEKKLLQQEAQERRQIQVEFDVHRPRDQPGLALREPWTFPSRLQADKHEDSNTTVVASRAYVSQSILPVELSLPSSEDGALPFNDLQYEQDLGGRYAAHLAAHDTRFFK